MSRGLAALAVIVAAFVIMMGILGVFAWIATAFPTTEDAFVKIGPTPKLDAPIQAQAAFRPCRLHPWPAGDTPWVSLIEGFCHEGWERGARAANVERGCRGVPRV